MGCAYAKPFTVEDRREARSRRSWSVGQVGQGKLSGSSVVPSSRRDELKDVKWTTEKAVVVERKQGSGELRANGHDAEMQNEMQVYPSHRQLRVNGSIPKLLEGEEVAAGWPAWLAAVAGEAIRGWVPRRVDSFEKLDQIGNGTYSNVYRARDLDSGKIVALKKVRFDSLEPESVRFMAREIHILRRLNHPNVIKLEGLVASSMSSSLYLVFEYMDHDLAGLSTHPGVKFTESQIKCYVQQLLCGLDYCHTRGVLHRDIKGSNLLIDNNGILKIADFGLASFFDPEQHHPLTSRVVTLWYRPPELLLGATNYGVAVDLWSTGCILAELYADKPILPGRTEVEQLHKIFKLCGSPSDDYWKQAKLPHSTIFKPQQPYQRCVVETFKDFPSPALALIEILLSVDPADRGTAASALESEFFTAEPLACEPSTLPKYPPCKEFDAKARDEDAKSRLSAAGGKAQKVELVSQGFVESRAVPAPDANAELLISMKIWQGQGTHKSRSEKYNPYQEEIASGFPIEPPWPNHMREAAELSHRPYRRKPSYSGPLVFQGQFKSRKKDDEVKPSSANNLSAVSGLVAASTNVFIEGSENKETQLESTALSAQFSESGNDLSDGGYSQLQHRGSIRKKDESFANQSLNQGFGPKGRKIHYSGPLLQPSGNIDQMLKDHDQQIREVIRRARVDRTKDRRSRGQSNLAPVYPSSRSSTIIFTSSRGVMQQSKVSEQLVLPS